MDLRRIVLIFLVSGLLFSLAPTVSAQPTWVEANYGDLVAANNLTAVHVVGPEHFWLAGSRTGATFLVRYRDGTFGSEVATPGVVMSFYNDGTNVYAIYSSPTVGALRLAGDSWVAADLFSSVPIPTPTSAFARDDGLWATGYIDGSLAAFQMSGGGWVDHCLRNPPSFVTSSGIAVDGLGRFYLRNMVACTVRGALPGANWANQSVDASDSIPGGFASSKVRVVSGELQVPSGTTVYRRPLAATAWSSFPVTELGANIRYVAGPDGLVYIGTNTTVLDHGNVMVVKTADGAIARGFSANNLGWSADGTVVVVGPNGAFTRRVPDTVPPPMPDNIDFTLTAIDADAMDLQDPQPGWVGGFKVTIRNDGDALDTFRLALKFDPRIANFASIAWLNDQRGVSCSPTGTAGDEVMCEHVGIGTQALASGDTAQLEIPVILRSDTEYRGSVRMDLTVTGIVGADSKSVTHPTVPLLLPISGTADLTWKNGGDSRAILLTNLGPDPSGVIDVSVVLGKIADYGRCTQTPMGCRLSPGLAPGEFHTLRVRGEEYEITALSQDTIDPDVTNNTISGFSEGCTVGGRSSRNTATLLLIIGVLVSWRPRQRGGRNRQQDVQAAARQPEGRRNTAVNGMQGAIRNGGLNVFVVGKPARSRASDKLCCSF